MSVGLLGSLLSLFVFLHFFTVSSVSVAGVCNIFGSSSLPLYHVLRGVGFNGVTQCPGYRALQLADHPSFFAVVLVPLSFPATLPRNVTIRFYPPLG